MSDTNVTTWTREVPKESGWYWVKGTWGDDASVHVVELTEDEAGQFLWISGSDERHDTSKFWWHPSPLTPPK